MCERGAGGVERRALGAPASVDFVRRPPPSETESSRRGRCSQRAEKGSSENWRGELLMGGLLN